jgi:GAF domain-containing protein
MARLGVSKKKKSPPAAELSQLKTELQRVSEELQSCKRERDEATEQQAATSEILGVIASSATDIQPVLDTVAENAARLCEANDAVIQRVDANLLRRVAHYGPIPATAAGEEMTVTRALLPGRAILDRQTLHVHDLAKAVETEFPEDKPYQQRFGARTVLVTPLLREGVPIGTIVIRRTDVRPFTDKQIALLKTFADQAVIAIENVRLFHELKRKTTELEASNSELRETLEQQTASGEILRVIASSPTDIQPVLHAIAESAARLCNAKDAVIRLVEGNVLRLAAHQGPIPFFAASEIPINRGSVTGRAVVDGQLIQVEDLLSVGATEFAEVRASAEREGDRTLLAVPLMREGVAIGAILIRRTVVDPFTDKQINLLKIFADQAVIAIENVRLFQELKESLEQQTATSEILGVIASSPTDIQPVLDAVAKSAARLCDATEVAIFRRDGDTLQRVANVGTVSDIDRIPITRGSVNGRAIVDKQIIQVPDLTVMGEEFPEGAQIQKQLGHRTSLVASLLREGEAIGTISIRRMEVRPFSDKQIALLKTFADQAVIAIENVRLFKEIQERNAELREALEHQTATAEVLGIISRSPTDVQPVLDAIVESAARVCGIDDVVLRLREGNSIVPRAHFGPIPIGHVRSIDEPQVRWIREHGTLHIPDVRAQNDFPTMGSSSARTFLFVPLRQQGEFVGLLVARRTEVNSFTPAQIKLLETFADQAVIAIENVRLFNELKESLEQQTATSEILGVIASSPTDIQPVLDVVAENAARLCGATDAQIVRVEGEFIRRVAGYGSIPHAMTSLRLISRGDPVGRAIIEKKTFHVHDITAEFDREFPESRLLQQRTGTRTFLVTPLLREDKAIGAIGIRRTKVKPFSDKQITLLKTFADQAVIAIENVRLFQELQARNRDLTEALNQQTATSEVLKVISRSVFDLQPVLETLVENAARLCEAEHAFILRVDDGLLRLAVTYNVSPEMRDFVARNPIVPGRYSITARAALERQTIHIPDILSDPEYTYAAWQVQPYRAALGVPMLRGDELLGVITLGRAEAQPFTDKQIELVTTFADQTVIAIENTRLLQELQARNRDLTEALEQQTATSEILRVIASSPTDIQPVLDAVAENAARLCDAKDAGILRVDGDILRPVASYGPMPRVDELPITRGIPGCRAVVDRQTIHVSDLAAELETEFPDSKLIQQVAGTRTLLATPLLRQGIAIGSIVIRRTEVRSFTDKQIKLLETFADQAVIAIENVRLFKEIQERNAELREALEHQTATAEVLGIISRSPTDVQPVLNAIVESAARVCGIDDVLLRLRQGNIMGVRAHFGSIPIQRVEISSDDPRFHWVHEHGRLHIPDVREQNEFPFPSETPVRTFLAAPLRLQGEFIGTLAARCIEVRPFTPAQIKLLETFADQAVIAIENVRLFQELKESLEQQTATSEILGVIASSPTDVQPVLNVVAENAARLCEANNAVIMRVFGESLQMAAYWGDVPESSRLNSVSYPITRWHPYWESHFGPADNPC